MVEIVESRYVPLPVAKKILEQHRRLVEENPVVARAYDYLAKFSKCDPDNAEEAFRRIVEIGFTEFAAAILVNIVPVDVEEAKAILGDIDGGYEEEKIAKALEVLKEYCPVES
ncbi:DNA-directed RNA polymerase subunit F [Hyperthermus butylicus]|uniref:DNA-directed RNA polymerase subunit Rpo4 n=1 Tax=Hyperthermus butylicus (strain DSM 5456 / JCM 9403 / PLM1-5) TaxID=415426 RepID=A2BNB2_HYPBU|nr:DNA-directed RNA polymerase subunit F [Hyperthermus butylicus]ABM81473.1 DNA-directed RNA polymerase, subunit F [Hyperthermus butylicus DSM 5456]